MAASTNQTGTGRRNFYNVSYGKISTKQKEVPEGYTEIAEATLKASIAAVEQVDLRKKFVNKGTGDYPNVVFYDSIEGVITAQEKFENDNGTNLNLTILDTDGDTSLLQMKFYSKYTENLLNRLLNTDTSKQFVFMPYQIPNTAEIEGSNKTFYTQGVSLKSVGQKIEGKYTKDNNYTVDGKSLPPTEQIKVQGKPQTSRDKRLDFLYDEFTKHFTAGVGSEPAPKNQVPTATPSGEFDPPAKKSENNHDDLPFG